jgi:hypothetical protein
MEIEIANIFSPEEFSQLLNFVNFEISDMGNEVFIKINPFDSESIKIFENIISQLRDVFF